MRVLVSNYNLIHSKYFLSYFTEYDYLHNPVFLLIYMKILSNMI